MRPLQLVSGLPPVRRVAGLGKTPWVDQTIRNVHDALLRNGVDSAWLPQELPPDKAPREHSVKEYGCGAYGCVMPTNQQGLVLKITSDATEAWFAHVAQQLARDDGWPRGIVHYRRVIGLVDQFWQGKMLYLLWRDEATSVGEVDRVVPNIRLLLDGYMDIVDVVMGIIQQGSIDSEARVLLAMAQSLEMFEQARTFVLKRDDAGMPLVEIVQEADSTLSKGPQSTAKVLSVALMCIYLAAGVIEQESNCRSLGGAIRYYLDQGLFLGDLHTGNVGLAYGDPYDRVVIVDPGLVSPLRAPYFNQAIPRRALLRS
jgi:hypothetical protein